MNALDHHHCHSNESTVTERVRERESVQSERKFLKTKTTIIKLLLQKTPYGSYHHQIKVTVEWRTHYTLNRCHCCCYSHTRMSIVVRRSQCPRPGLIVYSSLTLPYSVSFPGSTHTLIPREATSYVTGQCLSKCITLICFHCKLWPTIRLNFCEIFSHFITHRHIHTLALDCHSFSSCISA